MNTLEACRRDLFTKEIELREKYDSMLCDKIMRIREMYNWFLSNPGASDREFVAELLSRHDIAQRSAYNDLYVVKSLLPQLSKQTREFHRWRYNEMILRTYKMAAERKDFKAMERAATSYAKFNKIDLENETELPYDKIVVQPFTATDDPTVLGIKPIPNIKEKIRLLKEKYIKETIDIQDVEFEEPDLQLDMLYPLENGNDGNEIEESLLQ